MAALGDIVLYTERARGGAIISSPALVIGVSAGGLLDLLVHAPERDFRVRRVPHSPTDDDYRLIADRAAPDHWHQRPRTR